MALDVVMVREIAAALEMGCQCTADDYGGSTVQINYCFLHSNCIGWLRALLDERELTHREGWDACREAAVDLLRNGLQLHGETLERQLRETQGIAMDRGNDLIEAKAKAAKYDAGGGGSEGFLQHPIPVLGHSQGAKGA
jgi:hypothetical protein